LPEHRWRSNVNVVFIAGIDLYLKKVQNRYVVQVSDTTVMPQVSTAGIKAKIAFVLISAIRGKYY